MSLRFFQKTKVTNSNGVFNLILGLVLLAFIIYFRFQDIPDEDVKNMTWGNEQGSQIIPLIIGYLYLSIGKIASYFIFGAVSILLVATGVRKMTETIGIKETA